MRAALHGGAAGAAVTRRTSRSSSPTRAGCTGWRAVSTSRWTRAAGRQELADRHRHAWWSTTAAALYAGTLLAAGDPARAAAVLPPAVRIADVPGAEAYLLRCLAPLAEATGDLAVLERADALLWGSARRRAQPGCSAPTPTSAWRAPRRRRAGDADRADRAVAGLRDAAREVGWVRLAGQAGRLTADCKVAATGLGTVLVDRPPTMLARRPAMAIDNDKLMEFLGRFVGDLGATMAAGNIVVGHRLGLYRALGEAPATAAQLAKGTGTHPRYIAEWLRGQAAGGYVERSVSGDEETYALTEEQALCLTSPDNPVYAPGAFLFALGTLKAEPHITEAVRTGGGVGWHEHDTDVLRRLRASSSSGPGTSATSTPGSARWTASREKLQRGISVADVGCGLGASSVLMAQRWPASGINGSDYHGGSIELARKRAAADAGVSERVGFEVAGAQTFAGAGYELVTTFDCLHDMGDPLTAARHIRQALAPDGTWMIVEPFAQDDPSGNQNPVGRVYYNFSTFLCLPERDVAVRRLHARRAGGGGRNPPGGHRRRVHPVLPGRRDAVQHRLRGPSVAGPDRPRAPESLVPGAAREEGRDHAGCRAVEVRHRRPRRCPRRLRGIRRG